MDTCVLSANYVQRQNSLIRPRNHIRMWSDMEAIPPTRYIKASYIASRHNRVLCETYR